MPPTLKILILIKQVCVSITGQHLPIICVQFIQFSSLILFFNLALKIPVILPKANQYKCNPPPQEKNSDEKNVHVDCSY